MNLFFQLNVQIYVRMKFLIHISQILIILIKWYKKLKISITLLLIKLKVF